MVDFEVYLQGGSPWGFRLQGGREFRLAIRIAKVEPGGKAYNGGIQVGDHVTEIDGVNTDNMYHTEALTAVKRAQYSLSLLLTRPESNGEPGNTIQSVGLTPGKSSNTKVSLVIGPKPTAAVAASPSASSSSSTSIFNNYDTVADHNIPQGQTYMKKLLRNTNPVGHDEDLPPVERQRSKTLPKNEARNYQNQRPGATDSNQHNTTSQDAEYNRKSESMPRNLHPEYSSKSLPRQRHKSTSDAPSNKAPSWYRDMYKEMHTSMEKESHLSKLLASDAKRGAFRKYDGVTSPSMDGYQSATYEDAPRRLQGGGRSIANHPHRKSLPNIHAASYNFMADHNVKQPPVPVKPDVKSQHTTPPPVNSDWYRHMQKGGNIPDAGLAVQTSGSNSSTPRGPHSPKWESFIPAAPGDPPDIIEDRIKPQSITVEYNNPPDFLELRKQEIKNRELEKEREEIREHREKERLTEETRLLEQKRKDFFKIEEERRRLQLKEEELKRKEELLLQRTEEHENMQLKLREEELRRKEELLVKQEKLLNEKRLKEFKSPEQLRLEKLREQQEKKELEEIAKIKLKDEELKRKEEMLIKQEKELEEKRFSKIREEEVKRKELEEAELLVKLREDERKRRELEQAELFMKLREEERKQKELEETERLIKLRDDERKRKEREEQVRLRKLIEEENIRKQEEERLAKVEEEKKRRRRREDEREEQERILAEEKRRKDIAEQQYIARVQEEERRREEEEEKKRKELEEELRLQKLKEELQQKEEEERKELLAKEEELRKKEESLLKMEIEQAEKQRLLEESLKPSLPPFGKARYSFHPQGPGELAFKKGEIIKVIGPIDENWIEGEHKGKIGIFPVSYVELIETVEPVEFPVAQIPVAESPVVIDDNPSDLDIELIGGKEFVQDQTEESLEFLEDELKKHAEELGVVQPAVARAPAVVYEPEPEPVSEAEPEQVVAEPESESEPEPEPEPEVVVEEEVAVEAVAEEEEEAEVEVEFVPGFATARYTFRAETDSELSFKKGDEITLLKAVDDNWYEGEHNGKIGILPVNYVKVIKEPTIVEVVVDPEPEPEPEVFEADPEPAKAPVVIDQPMPANILKTKKPHDRKPSAEMLIDDVLNAHAAEKKAKEDPLVNGYEHTNGKSFIDDLIGQGDPYKAVYKYAATNEDEIELFIGDIVHVLEKCDDNWYIGTSQRTGAFGTFPGNYVSPV